MKLIVNIFKIYLDIAEPVGRATDPFEFVLTLTITVPSTNGAKPGKNLSNKINSIYLFGCIDGKTKSNQTKQKITNKHTKKENQNEKKMFGQ